MFIIFIALSLKTNHNLLNEEIKMILNQLNQYDSTNLANIDMMNINYIPAILFFENYIEEHLKLNKKIQSLHMVRDMING